MSGQKEHLLELDEAERKCIMEQHHAVEIQHQRLDAMLQLLLARHRIAQIVGYELTELGLIVRLPDDRPSTPPITAAHDAAKNRSVQATR
jgi:hypothetical protein